MPPRLAGTRSISILKRISRCVIFHIKAFVLHPAFHRRQPTTSLIAPQDTTTIQPDCDILELPPPAGDSNFRALRNALIEPGFMAHCLWRIPGDTLCNPHTNSNAQGNFTRAACRRGTAPAPEGFTLNQTTLPPKWRTRPSALAEDGSKASVAMGSGRAGRADKVDGSN